jgi:ABC-type antimicrobial peptide transport system permease subunit
MNIMLVTVSERVQEIGIRRAVGATKHDILSQFLLEGLCLSVMGGVVGIVGSAALVSFVNLFFSTFQLVIPFWSVVVSFFVSLVSGVVFSILPAFRASRVDPLEALRSL